ncbi:hypothetical protein MML61_00855 [Mycobacterium marinum]|uniref:hypothetical protein n=1 Tax=Mycobacterium marinum TaxID=1781 RepID=UPI000E3CF6CE|nr:hypothetical protein [Mycobacterium marinum]RFZ18492.1 hypothetical protein VIMS_01490 [Mycobacterium marinum]WCS18518.1 hypothetical protein MML61_00855 [Mycobacterium marinum]
MTEQLCRIERVAASDPRFGWAKQVEYTVFGLENNFASDADIAAAEMVHYRDWERSSEIFVSLDTAAPHQPVGVLRALRHDPELGLDSFSTLRDARNYPVDERTRRNFLYPRWSDFFDGIDPRRIAELATQGVLRSARRSGMIEQIWRAFFSSLAADGVDLVTVALVVPLFEWYRQLLPDRLHQIGEILPNYIGADSVPAVVDIGGSFISDSIRDMDADSASLLALTAQAPPAASAVPGPSGEEEREQ